MDRNTIVEFTLFGKDFGIYWYGVMIAIGILACFVTLFTYAKFKNVDQDFTDFCFYLAIFAIGFGLFAAALMQATYNYIDNPEAGFQLGNGLTFIGGLIGGVVFFLAIYVFVRHKFKDSLLKFMPIVGSCVTVAHGFGRIGCFIAGCCYGKPTCSDYGCYFDTFEKVHPTQLYESIFLFILCAVLTFLAFKMEFKYNMAIYLMSYGVFRFINEYFRGDDRGEFIPGVSPSQFWAIVMILIGIAYIFVVKHELFEKLGRAMDIARHNRNVRLGKTEEKPVEAKQEQDEHDEQK